MALLFAVPAGGALAQAGQSAQDPVAAGTGPTTNVPSSSDPAVTQTPGGSTEQSTAEVGETGDAQQDGPEGRDVTEVDALVVTGFRAAVTNAIATKRSSDQIVESISAEDIGKLPDNSIAESIARLPGVTAQRVEGRDQVISIRGFAPDFSTTLLNGREQVTTGDNRAVEFDQYPSELLGQVVIYKTPNAGLVGQGISGTIDLRTIRPLAYGRQVFAANARAETVTKGKLNADSEDTGYRVSGTYIDQFMDGRLGVTIGVAHNSSPSQFERYNAWGYPTFDGNNPTYGAPNGSGGFTVRPEFAEAQGKFVLGGAKPFVQSNMLERTGAVGTIEWRPSEELSTIVDVYYTKFQEQQTLRGIELPLYWGGVPLQPGYAVEGNTITSGTWNGVKGVVRNDYIERDAQIFSVGWNTKYEAGDWTLVGDASYSKVSREDFYLETYAGTSRYANNGPYDVLGFTTRGDGTAIFQPTLDYADPNLIKLTSPQGWSAGNVPGGQDGYLSTPDVDDALAAFRGSALRELGGNYFSAVEVGLNYTTREKNARAKGQYIVTASNQADPEHDSSFVVPAQYQLGTTNLDFLGIPGQVSFDALRLYQDGLLLPLFDPNASGTRNDYDIFEDVVTGWVRFDFDTQVRSATLTGNVGVQLVYTDQSSEGAITVNGSDDPTRVTGGDKYTEALPSLNMSMRFDDKNVLRFGLARTLARPRMDQLRGTFGYGTNPARATSTDPFNGYFAGGGGNPEVRPWIADGVDLSYEHYVSRQGYFALAGYYKYLESYIYDQIQLFDFTGLPLGGLPDGVTAPGTFIGTLRRPANGSGGSLYGAELSGTLPLNIISERLDGFGVLASYSYTKSEIQANPENPAQPLPGLSEHVASATAFYEKAGFSARISARYRSDFLAEVISLGPGARNRSARAETVMDAQVGYEFQSGALEGLGVLFQANNLTDEPFVTEDSANQLIIDSQSYGRRFLLGLAYKF